MSKKILLITDKDLRSKNLTGIELRVLQMKDYFQSLKMEVSVWQPNEKSSFFSRISSRFSIDSGLINKIKEVDYVYSSLTSSRSSTIFRLINTGLKVPLILDIFTPLLLEKQAASQDLEDKRRIIKQEIKAAQQYICATPKQKSYNIKMVKTLLNEKSTNISERMSVVPYFPPEIISHGDKSRSPLSKETIKIFWIGAFYPWFDEHKLQELIQKLGSSRVQFVILGGKNPKTKAYDKKFLEFHNWATQGEMTSQSVIFIDWLPYIDFQRLLRQADLAILFVKKTPEDKIAIRSRLISALMANVPVLTNGDDEVTNLSIGYNACWKVKHATEINLDELLSFITRSKKTNRWRFIRAEINKWKADTALIRFIKDSTTKATFSQ